MILSPFLFTNVVDDLGSLLLKAKELNIMDGFLLDQVREVVFQL